MGNVCTKPEGTLSVAELQRKRASNHGSNGTASTDETTPSHYNNDNNGHHYHHARDVLVVPSTPPPTRNPITTTISNNSIEEMLPSDEASHSLRRLASFGSLRVKRGGLLAASTYNEVHQKAASNIGSNGLRRSKSKRLRPVGVVGLNNMGNTCYLNSSLQCLSATIPLTDYFLGYNYRAEINKESVLGSKGKLATAYADLMSSMWSGKNLALRPKTFKGHLSSFAPQFEGSQQHDAQELLALLLDGIHEDLNRIPKKPYIEDRDCDGLNDERDAMEAWKNYLRRDKSIIVDIFQGQMRNSLTCLHCGHKNIRFEPFMYLSLPMTSECGSVQDCMEFYLAPETLSGENQWYCSKCKTHRDAVKKTDIWILPPILIVHLKRFKFDDFGNSVGSKNTAAVDYPIENWDLKAFVKSQSSDKPIYDLYAVSNHFGGLGSGHYTAYAMSRFGKEEWYEFNDSQTRRISEDTLRKNQAAAYLLFYNRRRIDPTGSPGNHKVMGNDPTITPGKSRHSRHHHEVTRIPLVRRQSINRPDLWPHTQVHHHQFREFSRSSVRVMEVAILEDEDVGGASDTFETSLKTTREVHWEI
ncbi:hypothetical protein ACA910_007939 [Epithemia clementina (nom. ined.)]